MQVGGKDSATGFVVKAFMQVEGVISVPRLSIIVPHIFGEAALETTLLSILENRPQGCELLVAHAGDYTDPYDLDCDEIHLIEAPAGSELIDLVNVAAREASGSVLQTILPGCVVDANWSAPALAWFQDSTIGSVSPSINPLDGKAQAYTGLEPQCLPRRAWSQRSRRGDRIVASLCGGFYRRQMIHSLNGWLNSGHREGAEVEMGLAIHALSMRGVAEPESQMSAPRNVIEGQLGGYQLGSYAGKLAMAYSQLVSSPLASDSFAARIGHLAGGLISPSSVAERLGWVLGLSDRSLVAEIRSRIEEAEASLSRYCSKPTKTQFGEARRAA